MTLSPRDNKLLIQAQIRGELEALGLNPQAIEAYLNDQLKQLEG